MISYMIRSELLSEALRRISVVSPIVPLEFTSIKFSEVVVGGTAVLPSIDSGLAIRGMNFLDLLLLSFEDILQARVNISYSLESFLFRLL